MAFRPGNINRKEQLDEEAKPFKGYSSATENFQASVGQVFDEELSISRALNDIGDQERNERINELRKSGNIPESVVDSFKTSNGPRGNSYRINYNDLTKYVNENLDLDEDIPTNEELTISRDKDLDMRRKYREDVYNRALTGGDIASFGGSMIAAGLDPVNYIPIAGATVTGARATSRAMYSLSMAKKGAIGGVVAAAAVEPFIYSWKEEIGAPYTVKDAMFNLAASGIMSGAISGVAGNIAHRLNSKPRTITEKNRKSTAEQIAESENIDIEQAEDIVQYMYESQQAPNKKMDAEEFVKKTEDTQESINNSTKATDDSEPQFSAEDEGIIDSAFDELEDDFTNIEFDLMMDDDGNMVIRSSFAEADAEYQSKIDEFEEKLGCLTK